MQKSEKEWSMGEYLSCHSTESGDLCNDTVQSRVEIWPKEWTQDFMCYRDPNNPDYCYTDFKPSSFCKDKIRIM